MHNLESFLENETHKILWDFEIQTGHLISARRPDLVIVNKKKPKQKKQKTKKQNKKNRTCRTGDFAVPADNWVKLKESVKKDKYLELTRELKKL